MARLTAALSSRVDRGALDEFYRGAVQVSERAALVATDRASVRALSSIRQAMQGAQLGRLGNALGRSSDLLRNEGVHRFGQDGFSASGVVFVRSQSERSRGAIEAYTAGAEIRPVRGRFLWIASDDLPRVTGRERMTPELYRRNGWEQKLGPLFFARSASGTPLLMVRNVGLSQAGGARSAKPLTKKGLPRKGQYRAEAIIAFYGVPRTARAARVDTRGILAQAQSELPALFEQAMRGQRRV